MAKLKPGFHWGVKTSIWKRRLTCLFKIMCGAVLITPSVGQADADVLLAPIRAITKSVEACLASAQFDVDPASCAGVSYEICIGFIVGPVSHDQQGGCNWDELGIWEIIYQEEVMKKLQWAQKMDEDSAQGMQLSINAFAQIMETEMAWNAYRKTQCKMELLPSLGGTNGITSIPLCHIRMFARRIQLLQRLDNMELME